MRSKEQQPYDVLVRGGKRSTLCKALRTQWSVVTGGSREFTGVGPESETDDYHNKPVPPTESPPTVAAAILTKQDSDLFLYVTLFASWVALENEDQQQIFESDAAKVTEFIHSKAPQTVPELVHRIIALLPRVLGAPSLGESSNKQNQNQNQNGTNGNTNNEQESIPMFLDERQARVFNVVSCLCSAPSLTSSEIARVCEEVYGNRRHSVLPLLTVMEHYGLIERRFDGCLACAHPVIRAAFESFSIKETRRRQLETAQAAARHEQQQRHQQQLEESSRAESTSSSTALRAATGGGAGGGGGMTRDFFGASHSSTALNQELRQQQQQQHHHNQHHQQEGGSSSGNAELDACRSAFAVIHHHAVCNLTVGFIRSFAILPDLLIHSAQPSKLVQILDDVVLLDAIVREHATGSVYVVDAMVRCIHHLSSLSHVYTIEGHTRHQFAHSAALGRLTRSLRDFLKIRSGNLWQAALALQHDSTLFQAATKQFDKAPYPSLCLRNRTDAESQSLEMHTPSSSTRDKSLRHCCLADPFLAVTGAAGTVTIYEMTRIGGSRASSKTVPPPPPSSPEKKKSGGRGGGGTEGEDSPQQDEYRRCFRELCRHDFSTLGIGSDILGCIVSTGLSPVALVVSVDHCAIWRFGESSQSPSYISKIENCTASIRHEVFAPGGSTFAGVAFLEGETAMERKVVVVDVASAKVSSVVNAPPNIFVREAHYVGAAGVLVVEPQGMIMCRHDGAVLPLRSHHLSQSHSIRAVAHSRDGGFIGAVSGPRAMMWHVGRNPNIHEEMPMHTVSTSSPLLDLSFIPSGAQAAIVAEDGTVLVWNTITGLLHHTLKVETPDPPAFCTFTPNGRIVVRAGTALRMWDVVTMQDMGGIIGHEGVINFMENSGALLVSVCDCGTMKVWDLNPSFPPLTMFRESAGRPTSDLYRYGFMGPKAVHKIAVSDDQSFVAIQIGKYRNEEDEMMSASALSGPSSAVGDDSGHIETTLWAVDIERSPLGEYDSAAPFVRKLPEGIMSSPLFLASPQQQQEQQHQQEQQQKKGALVSAAGNSDSSNNNSPPSSDDVVLCYIDEKKQLIKHFCESGESVVVGALPREILDGYVELYQRADGILGSSSSSCGVAVTSGKTLGGCRIVIYSVPAGTSRAPATLVAQFVGHVDVITGLDFLPGAVVSASRDSQLTLWSMSSKAEKTTKKFDAPLVAMCRIFEGEYMATGLGLYCLADQAGSVMIVDTNGWNINIVRRILIPHTVLLMQPLFHANTLLMLLEGNETELFVWDVDEMKPINRLEIARTGCVSCLSMVSPQFVDSDPAESYGLLAFAGTGSGVVKMYSAEG